MCKNKAVPQFREGKIGEQTAGQAKVADDFCTCDMKLAPGSRAAISEVLSASIEKGTEEMKRPTSFKPRSASRNPDGIKDKDRG